MSNNDEVDSGTFRKMECLPDDATKRQLEYIRMLEERNKLKKKMEKKSHVEDRHSKLEKGFSTAFRGANTKINRNIQSAPMRRKSTQSVRKQWAKSPDMEFNIGKHGQLECRTSNENKEDQYSDDSFEALDSSSSDASEFESHARKEAFTNTTFSNDLVVADNTAEHLNSIAKNASSPTKHTAEHLNSIAKHTASPTKHTASSTKHATKLLENNNGGASVDTRSFYDGVRTEAKQTQGSDTDSDSIEMEIQVEYKPSGAERSNSITSPIDSPVLKFMKSAGKTDAAMLRESLQRIYCDEDDHTMDVGDGKVSKSQHKKKEKHALPRRMTDAKDSEDTALAIREAIMAENERVKGRKKSVEAKEVVNVEAKEEINRNSTKHEEVMNKKTVEHEKEMNGNPTKHEKDVNSKDVESSELIGLMQNIPMHQQKKLAIILEKLKQGEDLSMDDTECIKKVDREQASTLVDENIKRQEEYLEKLKLQHDQEEKRLKDAEIRRKQRLLEMEQEEMEYEARMLQRRKERIEKLKLEEQEELRLEQQRSVPEETTEILFSPKSDDLENRIGTNIRIKLLSSWSKHSITTGLNLIEALDVNGRVLNVPTDPLCILDGYGENRVSRSDQMVHTLNDLFDVSRPTWHGRLSDAGSIQLCFQVLADTPAVSLRVYNNSTNPKHGVRDIEVFKNDEWVWSGSIAENHAGHTSSVPEYTTIPLVKVLRTAQAKQSSSNTTASHNIQNDTSNDSMDQKNNDNSSTECKGESYKEEQDAPCWLTASSKVNSKNDLLFDNSEQQTARPARSKKGGVVPGKIQNEKLLASWDSLDSICKSKNLSRIDAQDMDITPIDSTFKSSPMPYPDSSPSMDDMMQEFTLKEAVMPTEQVQEGFAIPVLPKGRQLRLELLSTWGDPHYIGLNGIDIFDGSGNTISLSNPSVQAVAEPESINVLVEYENDPRKVQNLFDHNNFTCDDLHVWLAPYDQGKNHSITINFDGMTTISLLRIWNYNKSRTHSYRGVCDIRVSLDDAIIFEGQIRKAPGTLAMDTEKCCEVILFTMDEVLLDIIDSTDAMSSAFSTKPYDETTSIVAQTMKEMEMRRPTTGNGQRESYLSRKQNAYDKEHESYDEMKASCHHEEILSPSGRPMTAASKTFFKSHEIYESPLEKIQDDTIDYPAISQYDTPKMKEDLLPYGKHIVLQLRETWGDLHYVGLTGILVLTGSSATPICLGSDAVDASPRDLHSLGNYGDPRTVDKVVDNHNDTCDDAHMWLIPFQHGGEQMYSLQLPEKDHIYGLVVWNYNKNIEDSYRGVRRMEIFVDGENISPNGGTLVRKAPGNLEYDFGQVIYFTPTKHAIHAPLRNYISPTISQDYETPLFPCGFELKFMLLSTWGDPYYLGLNGIELYDESNTRIELQPTKLTAKPRSLEDIQVQDVRVPENLVNHDNNTWDSSSAWLSPLATCSDPNACNLIYFVYDKPITLSMIKFWNYSKNQERGVRELEIWMDNLQIFRGFLRPAPLAPTRGKNGKMQVVSDFSQPILFTNHISTIAKEKIKVDYCGSHDQDVLCINEGNVVERPKQALHKEIHGADLDARPMTAVVSKK